MNLPCRGERGSRQVRASLPPAAFLARSLVVLGWELVLSLAIMNRVSALCLRARLSYLAFAARRCGTGLRCVDNLSGRTGHERACVMPLADLTMEFLTANQQSGGRRSLSPTLRDGLRHEHGAGEHYLAVRALQHSTARISTRGKET